MVIKAMIMNEKNSTLSYFIALSAVHMNTLFNISSLMKIFLKMQLKDVLLNE